VTLRGSGRLHLVRRFDADSLLEVLADPMCTRVAVVPTMIRMMLPLLEQSSSHPLRQRVDDLLVISGGEVLAGATGQRLRTVLPRGQIADVYGLSETATSDFVLRPELYDDNPGTVGWPTDGVAYRLADPETDSPMLLTGSYRSRPHLRSRAISMIVKRPRMHSRTGTFGRAISHARLRVERLRSWAASNRSSSAVDLGADA
jgi:acyl-CoA synthetase (AMP-forming)/AMP-acid ligase II